MKHKLHSQQNIILLLMGRTVSRFGSAFYLIALPLYVLQMTGSLAQTGVFFSLSSLPSLVVTPFLGVFVDKMNRKRLLVVCDLLTAALYALLLLPLKAEMFLPLLFVVTVLINVLSNAFEIGSKLMFSELTTPETIEKYNGIKSFADNAAAVIAPALGTIAFGLWGFGIVVLVVTVGYTLSAVQECFILYQKTDQMSELQKKMADPVLGRHSICGKSKRRTVPVCPGDGSELFRSQRGGDHQPRHHCTEIRHFGGTVWNDLLGGSGGHFGCRVIYLPKQVDRPAEKYEKSVSAQQYLDGSDWRRLAVYDGGADGVLRPVSALGVPVGGGDFLRQRAADLLSADPRVYRLPGSLFCLAQLFLRPADSAGHHLYRFSGLRSGSRPCIYHQ